MALCGIEQVNLNTYIKILGICSSFNRRLENNENEVYHKNWKIIEIVDNATAIN